MDPYIGEIRLFAGNYAPKGWALCDGTTMYVQQNPILFSIVGSIYGGDGKTTFALPNFLGMAPMGQGAGPGLTPRKIAAVVGESTEILILDQIPNHSHVPNASNATTGGVADPTNAVWGGKGSLPSTNRSYSPNATVQMNALSLNSAGNNNAHNNMQPFVALNFIIALEGIYPQKS